MKAAVALIALLGVTGGLHYDARKATKDYKKDHTRVRVANCQDAPAAADQCPGGTEYPTLDPDVVRISLVHWNDVHARVEYTTLGGAPCDPNADEDCLGACGGDSACEDECFQGNEGCVGGMAKLSYISKAAQTHAECRGTIPLVLDAGDEFMGTVWNTYYKGDAIKTFMNMMPIDAFALGNHEFDFGPGVLAAFTKDLQTNIVACNIDFSEEPEFAGQDIPHYVILERTMPAETPGDERTVKIAVIGLTIADTPKLSASGDYIKFEEEVVALEKCIEEVKTDVPDYDFIIVLSHCGITTDIELADALGQDITLIVGAHSHTPMGNMTSGGGTTGFTYPHYVNEVPIVQAECYSYYAGILAELDIDLNTKRIVKDELSPIPVLMSHDETTYGSYVPDECEVATEIAAMSEELDEFRGEEVCTTEHYLNGEREFVRSVETNLADLVAESYLWYLKTQTPIPDENPGVYLSFQNGGGVRASIDIGTVTVEDCINVLPFGDVLDVLTCTGEQIKIALENGVSAWVAPDGGEQEGRFAQVAGFTYLFDPDKTANVDRILGAWVRQDLATPIEYGEHIDFTSDSQYYVVASSFVANGGDHYDVFSDCGRVATAVQSGETVFSMYLESFGHVVRTEEGDARIVNEKHNYLEELTPWHKGTTQEPEEDLGVAAFPSLLILGSMLVLL